MPQVETHAVQAPPPSTALPRVAELVSRAFGSSIPDALDWLTAANHGETSLRALARPETPDQPDACLRVIPMGQYFGGRSVPMAGIAGVAVAPEARGQGLARQLMTATLRELAASGVPLSTLFATTQTLYRQVGYEQAGHRGALTVPLSSVDVHDRPRPPHCWRKLPDFDPAPLLPLHRRFVAQTDGMLDRGPYAWRRVWDWRERKATVYALPVAPGSDQLLAYVAIAPTKDAHGDRSLAIADLAYDSPTGARAILGFLHDFGSMVRTIQIPSGPFHPLLMLLGQQRFTYAHQDFWMLRIAHAPAAVAARAFPAHVSATMHIELTDSIVSSNHGRFELSVRGGAGKLAPLAADAVAEGLGSAPGVKLSINALASLYAGFISAPHLRSLGMIDADDAATGTLHAIFPPGCPSMIDFF